MVPWPTRRSEGAELWLSGGRGGSDPRGAPSRIVPVGVHHLSAQVTDDVAREVEAVSSPLLGWLWAPKTLDEYVSIVQGRGLGANPLSGWRGQADIAWPLHSTALRRLRADQEAASWGTIPRTTDDPDENLVAEYETRLMELARSAGHGYRAERRLSDLELLALLQHHGAATRLLDWTANVLVALWFACRGEPDNFGAVYGVSLENVWRLATEQHRSRSFAQLLEDAEERMTYFQPPPLTPRIPAQAGFFLWSRVQHRDWSSLGTLAAEPLQTNAISMLSEEFSAIAVTPQLKKYMRGRWKDLFGFADYTLFPDFDGFSSAHAARAELPWDFFVDPR